MSLKPIARPDVFNGAGKNFMTPDIINYYKLRSGYGYAELSEGEGFHREPIYGVTIRPEQKPSLSRMFRSKIDAIEYIGDFS